MSITFGSVCSGIGAPEVAWESLGWTPIWSSEIEAHPSTILAHHNPSVPNMGDMTKLPAMMRMGLLMAPDVLVGGTPCQAFSIAGMRGGLNDQRGQLTLTYVDLANAIDEQRPDGDECVVVWENVPGVLSDSGNAFGHFLAALAGEDVPLECAGGKWSNAGVVVGPQRSIAWRILDAQYFGVAQRRRRVFVVASARVGFDPAAVLFELDGVRRNSAPRRGEGQEITAGTLRSTDGGCDVDHARAGHVLTCASNAEGTKGLPFLTCSNIAKTVNNQTPLLAFDSRQECVSSPHVFGALGSSLPQAQAVSYAIQAGALRTNPASGPDGVGVQAHIAYTLEARAEVQAVCITGDITHTLKAEGFDASEDGTGRGQPIIATTLPMGCDGAIDGPVPPLMARSSRGNAQTLSPGHQTDGHMIGIGMAVRRLTPRECERLQGFPDDYTLVPHRDFKGRRNGSVRMMADGPRYKALGNSMCVHVMRWIGIRIMCNYRAGAA